VTEYISGPTRITYYTSKKYNKNIYIFGEIHGREDSCDGLDINSTPIDSYLDKLFRNTDVFIDFFLEIDPVDMDVYKYIKGPKYIDNLRHMAYNCIRQTPDCKYPLIRAHYTDPRLSNDASQVILNFLDRLDVNNINLSQKYTKLFIGKMGNDQYKRIRFLGENLPKFNRAMILLKDITIYDYYTFIKRYARPPLLYKEISKSNMADFFNQKLKEYTDSGEKYFKILQDSIKTFLITLNPTKEQVDKIKYSFQSITLSIMDVYLLSRVFKTFKVPETTYQPAEPHNIIIYAGNAHSDNYRQLLEEMGFLVKGFGRPYIKNRKKYNRCLNMTKIDQPFFNI